MNQIAARAVTWQLAIVLFESLHMHTKLAHSFVRGLGHLKVITVIINEEVVI